MISDEKRGTNVEGSSGREHKDSGFSREKIESTPVMQLIINPGSTSTKLAIYENEDCIIQKNVEHDGGEINKYDRLSDQIPMRINAVKDFIKDAGYKLGDFHGIVGRGGLVYGIGGGGYRVNGQLVKALSSEEYSSPHASNLGGLIGRKLADEVGIEAYIYDAVMGAYLSDIARTTGFPEIRKQPTCHVLNSRAMAMKVCHDMGKEYEHSNVIVAHIGGGTSLSLHENGKIIDTVGDDEGPMSPERSGGSQLLAFLNLYEKGGFSKEQMKKKIRGEGGLYAYLHTKDGREIEERISKGDTLAELVYNAMGYQIAKAIGTLAPAVYGKLDAVILTGGLAHSKMLTEMIMERVSYLAPVKIRPGECEMEALALGGLRIQEGVEAAKEFNLEEVQTMR